MRDQYCRHGEWFLVLVSGNDHDRFRWERDEVGREATRIRRAKDLEDDEPLPAFLVVRSLLSEKQMHVVLTFVQGK